MDKMTIDASKDYYSILGVLPSIEPSALRAVYLALLKKYHPDVYKGDKIEAERITKEINEAYEILGNQEKKAEYDSQRNNNSSVGGDFSRESKEKSDENKEEIENDWRFIIEYFPLAENDRVHLMKISSSLARMYQYILITEKSASKHKEISKTLQFEYLRRYFGKNIKVHDLIIKLLEKNRKDAALEINKYYRVFGEISDKNLYEIEENLITKFKWSSNELEIIFNSIPVNHYSNSNKNLKKPWGETWIEKSDSKNLTKDVSASLRFLFIIIFLLLLYFSQDKLPEIGRAIDRFFGLR